MSTSPDQFDRLPPHSIEAERCLIASMLVDRSVISEVLALVDRDAFYQADHQIYFDVIVDLHRSDKAVDSVIVMDQLKKRQLFDEAGGKDYLVILLDSVPSSSHAMHYAKIVREKKIGRGLIETANNLLRDAYRPYTDDGYYLELAQKFERRAAALAVSGTLPTIITLNDAIEELIRQKEEGEVRRIPTGLSELDSYIGGGVPVGKWTLLAGKPGMGKSQLGKQIVLNACEDGRNAGIISIEEDRLKIAANMIANISGVNNEHITCAKWDGSDYKAAHNAMGEARGRFFIEDSSERLTELEAMVTLMAIKHQCELVVIDHIHLADAQAPNKSREQQVALISKTLKMLAKRMDIALIGLCQLNRGGGQEHTRPPILSDLRDSGSLEADGDLILMLHRMDYFHQGEPGYTKDNKLTCYIRKLKDGSPGELPLYFDGDRQRITNWTEESSFDSPSPYGNVRAYAPRTNGISFDD